LWVISKDNRDHSAARAVDLLRLPGVAAVEVLRRTRTIGNREIAIPKVAAIGLAYIIILTAIVVVVFVILRV
jgi:hypothetical protein